MEVANIAFHIENTSKRSILERRWRKCNMKEKLDNLHNENRGKRVILWKFLNDGQLYKDYNPVLTDREDSGNSAGDCESYDSYSLNGYKSRTTLNQAHLFDDGYSCDSLSSSDSSSVLADWLRPGLTREEGDGSETPNIPRYISNLGARKRLQRRVTGADEPCHKHVSRNMEYSNRELEYSCTLRLFAEPEEPSTSSAHGHGHGITSPLITKITGIHSNNKCVSSTDMNNTDCLNEESSQHKQCNVFTLTKIRLTHNAKSKLKQLRKLYKSRKLNKKRRGTELVKSIGKGNALNTDGGNKLPSGKQVCTSGPSQNIIHEDMCQTLGLDNRNIWCAPDRDTVRQVCESTEKNDIVSNRLADFYDCDCLDLAMDCYCCETDELAYLNNGFMMD